MPATFVPDAQQQAVIDHHGSTALVLAAPGCGKTEILSHRVVKAHRDHGVPYDQMLCLTFTNRASREMRDRVWRTCDEPPEGLFVGNLHRFCVRFLFDNHLVPPDTHIIDDLDQFEMVDGANRRQWDTTAILNRATQLTQQSLHHPIDLWLHKSDYTLQTQRAKEYINLKRDYHGIDYDDLLVFTFEELSKPNYRSYLYSSYDWIEVDEVQDMSPLQLAIVYRLLSNSPQATLVLLGDERQAIFSFIGATPEHFGQLTSQYSRQTYRLRHNYRAPRYMVEMLNEFARRQFGVSDDELPISGSDTVRPDGLTIVYANRQNEVNLLSVMTRMMLTRHPDEHVAVLVGTNRAGQDVADKLASHHVSTFLLTRNDLFKQVSYKTLCAHLAVAANDLCYTDWARLFYQMRVLPTLRQCMNMMSAMRSMGMSPADLLRNEPTTETASFARAMSQGEVVVFDTETTGLDPDNDDIIQIAAVAVRNQQIVERFEVMMASDRPLPATLGNGAPNPMIAAYASADKVSPAEGLERFVRFVHRRPLVGHNVGFDIAILRTNLERHASNSVKASIDLDHHWDTLHLSRLLFPSMTRYTLQHLIEHLGLDGVNSHNATDDVKATVALAEACRINANCMAERQLNFLTDSANTRMIRRLQKTYGPYYHHTRRRLADRTVDKEALVIELQWVYGNMVQSSFITPIKRWEYVKLLLQHVVFDPTGDNTFARQLDIHLQELRTFNEGDFYHNGIINETVHIMTVHKAKGLEFDNVILQDLSSYNRWQQHESDRMLYVALSRARKRLILCHTAELALPSALDAHLMSRFNTIPQDYIDQMLAMESFFTRQG